MKYIKKYKIFESTKSIDDICREYGIQNYTINPDGSVDVDGDVNLTFKGLEKIPIKFGNVKGEFSCYHNKLTSLEGCPKSVDILRAYNNKLKSFIGTPKVVNTLQVNDNEILSLKGLEYSSITYLQYSNNPIHHITYNWLRENSSPDLYKVELFNDLDIIVGNKLYYEKLLYFHENTDIPLPHWTKFDFESFLVKEAILGSYEIIY
jgi:hypothetical protein